MELFNHYFILEILTLSKILLLQTLFYEYLYIDIFTYLYMCFPKDTSPQ